MPSCSLNIANEPAIYVVQSCMHGPEATRPPDEMSVQLGCDDFEPSVMECVPEQAAIIGPQVDELMLAAKVR